MTDYTRLRETMVENQLKTSGVNNRSELKAFLEIPREQFLPDEQKQLSYLDKDIEISAGQFLLSPASHALLLQLSGVNDKMHVLDVGCGTGYSTAILSALAKSVVGLVQDKNLEEQGTKSLQSLNIKNAEIISGDLAKGYSTKSPYDLIIINGAVDEVPRVFASQLKEDGKLVAVVGRGRTAKAHIFVKSGDGLSGAPRFDLALPSLPEFQHEDGFAFAV